MKAAIARMDAGLQLAVDVAGGRRALYRKLGLHECGKPWRTCPQDRVFQVAEVTGIPPKILRPDLEDWIDQEIARRELAAGGGGANLLLLGQAVVQRWDAPAIEEGLVDLWSSLASVHFVARIRGLKAPEIYSGPLRCHEAARAYAMALAKVVGRARSTHIAGVFGCSRQNVDNATERYLRARDGDDPDDYITGQFPDGAPRVLERGANRLRHPKEANAELWEAEETFAAFLNGEQLDLPKPERRRA